MRDGVIHLGIEDAALEGAVLLEAFLELVGADEFPLLRDSVEI